MRAEEIQGLMEAYSKVHETPEVIEEGLYDAANVRKTQQAQQGRDALKNVGGYAGLSQAARAAGDTAGAQRYMQKSQAIGDKAKAQQAAAAQTAAAKASANRQADIAAYRQAFGTSAPKKSQPTFQNSGGFGRYGDPGSQVKTPASNPPAARPPASNPPAARPPASTRPVSTSSPKPSTPTAPAKPAGSPMDQWRAAHKDLAAAADEKARIRGTAQTDNPLMKDMRSRLPLTPSVQSPTLKKDLGNLAGNYTRLTVDNPNAAIAATPKPKPVATPAATSTVSQTAAIAKASPTPTAAPAATATPKSPVKPMTKPSSPSTQLFHTDLFDLVKGHLLDEGYAETEEAAVVMMANMSDEWRESILEGYGVDLEETKKWIQAAIKHPGALHRKLHVPAGEKIPAGKLAAAAKKGGKLGKRARLAQTLKGLKEGTKGDGNLANNYPPYDKVTRGDIIAGALGQDQMGGKNKKKKVTAEEVEAYTQVYVPQESVEEAYKEPRLDRKAFVKHANRRSGFSLGSTEDPYGWRETGMEKVAKEYAARTSSARRAKRTGEPDAYRASKEAQSKFKKEELEAWVDELIAEGYDLSDYTWDEVAEIYMEELQQLDEISLKTKMRAYAASRDVDADYAYGSKVHDQGDRIKANIVKKHGEKAGEHAERHADVSNFGRRDASGKYKGLPKSRIEKSDYRTTAAGKMHKQDQSELKRELRIRRGQKLRAADADDDN